jgi:flagellar biosynthesis GTPase FlhF
MLMCVGSVQAQDMLKQAEQKAKDEAQKQVEKEAKKQATQEAEKLASQAKEKAMEEAKKQGEHVAKDAMKSAEEQAKDAMKGAPAGQDMASMSPDQMMAMWEKANATGPSHAWMQENMVGEWDAKTSWTMDPKGPMTNESAKARGVSMFNGRFVRWDYSGMMMGKQYSGMGFFGYNNATKQFEQLWVDSASTGFFNMTGTQQADGSILFKGSMKNPLTGQDAPSKASMKMTDKNTMQFDMFEIASDGTEFKSMAITYTRVSGQ